MFRCVQTTVDSEKGERTNCEPLKTLRRYRSMHLKAGHNLVVTVECLINNFVALRLWRLGARDILELPLLATSSKMETALMAGQT